MGLLKKTDYNAKISKIENEIRSISGSTTSFELDAVENKMPDVSNLIKKTNYNANITDIESKYTGNYNKFTKNIVDNSIKSKNFVDKFDINGFINNADLDKKKVATVETKTELKAEQDKISKLQAFDLNYFRDKNHFEEEGTQNTQNTDI